VQHLDLAVVPAQWHRNGDLASGGPEKFVKSVVEAELSYGFGELVLG
jgi:hypothetical protein